MQYKVEPVITEEFRNNLNGIIKVFERRIEALKKKLEKQVAEQEKQSKTMENFYKF